MIAGLRRRFVAMNMALVGTALLVVFSAVLYSNYQRMNQDGLHMLSRTLDKEGGSNLPQIGKQPPDERGNPSPVFQVTVDSQGNLLGGKYQHIEITPEDLNDIIAQVIQAKSDRGNLRAYHLRFLVRSTPEGNLRIAFGDLRNEVSMLSRLAISFALVWVAALFAFFWISLFLSRLALAPVERAWQQQRQFVADASHELKTPLTIILANLNILSTAPQKTIGEQFKWLENTQAEGKRMKTLIDDLLFLAKSDAGEEKVLYQKVCLSEVIWSMVLPFESVAFEGGITMQTQIQENVYVLGEERKLKQLVAILLDNACKYCGKNGTVSVALSLQDNRTVLTVQNSGEPLAKEDLAHIFDRFYRADKARVHKQGGYGLGLSIAQSIATLHNAKIHCESDSLQGTRFSVRFPSLSEE